MQMGFNANSLQTRALAVVAGGQGLASWVYLCLTASLATPYLLANTRQTFTAKCGCLTANAEQNPILTSLLARLVQFCGYKIIPLP